MGKQSRTPCGANPHARPHPTRGSFAVLFPVLLYFRAAGCVCSGPEQLGNSGKSFVEQFSGAAQDGAKRANYLLQSHPRPPSPTSETAGIVPHYRRELIEVGTDPFPGADPNSNSDLSAS